MVDIKAFEGPFLQVALRQRLLLEPKDEFQRTHSQAVAGVNPELRLQLVSLGATRTQVTWTVLREARLGLVVVQM